MPLQRSSPPRLTVRPGGRIRPPWGLLPFNGILGVVPILGGVAFPAGLRSRVFSTPQRLPSKSKFHGLVSCRNRSWDSLLQSVPLARIAHPSRGHMLPCGYPPTLEDVLPKPLLPRVSPTSTLSRSCLDPRTTMASLSTHPPGAATNRSPLSHPSKHAFRSAWVSSSGTVPSHQLHPLRSLDPPASPFVPPRVTPRRPPILSWISAPLEFPFTPRVLDPSRTRKSGLVPTRSNITHDPAPEPESSGLRPRPPPEDAEPRLKGPFDPPSQVSPSQHQKRKNDLVDGFRSLGDRPAPALADAPTPLVLEPRASPTLPTFGALKCLYGDASPKRYARLL
jgi:hypothetical protein